MSIVIFLTLRYNNIHFKDGVTSNNLGDITRKSVDRDTKIDYCDTRDCWKQNKIIDYRDNAVHTHESVDTAFLSTYAQLLVILPFF